MSAVTLARALSRHSRVVLIDLALGAPNFAAISTDPQAPGVAEVVRGMASFGDVITRDKLSRVHLIGAGRIGADGVDDPRLAAPRRCWSRALARTYDHVIIDAGAAPSKPPVERLYRLAPRAVLVATDQVRRRNQGGARASWRRPATARLRCSTAPRTPRPQWRHEGGDWIRAHSSATGHARACRRPSRLYGAQERRGCPRLASEATPFFERLARP